MVTIYQRTCTGGIQVFPYTHEGQFKSHVQAYRYLNSLNRSYNASCTFVTQMSYEKAKRIYCDV